MESPSGSGRYVTTINLRPDGKTVYGQVIFDIENSGSPSDWMLNIGDSPSNDGYSGDSGDKQNDAELQVMNNSLAVYASDLGSSSLLYSQSSIMPLTGARNLRVIVGNGYVTFIQNGIESTRKTITNSNLFALAGQADTGGTDYKIYAGFNRSIGSSSRTGSGITKVTVTLDNPKPDPAINGSTASTQTYNAETTLLLKDKNAASSNYFVAVQHANSSWQVDGPEALSWLYEYENQCILNGTFNIKDFGQYNGVRMWPGNYYKVKLAIAEGWNEVSRLVYINPPIKKDTVKVTGWVEVGYFDQATVVYQNRAVTESGWTWYRAIDHYSNDVDDEIWVMIRDTDPNKPQGSRVILFDGWDAANLPIIHTDIIVGM